MASFLAVPREAVRW